jgi:dipeptidyl aminopeptidase/acylaminoacyl peptidase
MNTPRARLIHTEETLFRTRPQWSPDGKRFVYASHLGGQYTNLFVLPTAGGEPYKLTFGEHDTFLPRWSPDGEWIAAISNVEGLPQLTLLKAWGGEQRICLASPRSDGCGRWRRSSCGFSTARRPRDRGARVPDGQRRQAVHAVGRVRAAGAAAAARSSTRAGGTSRRCRRAPSRSKW